MPRMRDLGDPDVPYSGELMGQRNRKSKRKDFWAPSGRVKGAMRDSKAGSGAALGDQDSKGKEFEELRCQVPKGLEAGREREEGGGGSQGCGGRGLEADSGQPAAVVFPTCFPVVPLSSISSCFQAIKFFPGEIRGPPTPPRACHV